PGIGSGSAEVAGDVAEAWARATCTGNSITFTGAGATMNRGSSSIAAATPVPAADVRSMTVECLAEAEDTDADTAALTVECAPCQGTASPESRSPKIHSSIWRATRGERSRKRMPHCPEKVDQTTSPRVSTRNRG